jgi:predicted glycosyl hydrolase (DUF1957 family)
MFNFIIKLKDLDEMKKITWVNFLHIYQPPWQQRGIIEQVASESYEYLLTLWEKYPNFKTTLNITGNLIEQWQEVRPDLLKRLQRLVKKGQVELVGSAKYHAILPLLSIKEARRQIKLNQQTLSQYFDSQKITGFYLPEMAYSDSVAKIIKQAGFKYLILDQVHFNGEIDNNVLYKIKKIGLQVVFRNRATSKHYPPEIIYKKFDSLKNDEIIISATDGEMYGHQHEDWHGYIEKILTNKKLQVITINNYLKKLKTTRLINLRAASWETTPAELKKRIHYALWQDPSNKIHKLLWKLVDQASRLVDKYKGDPNWHWARTHLDRGVSSCTFWWASAKKPSEWSPLTWNPDMIDNGSEELIRAIRSLEKATAAEKIKAEKIFIDIKKETWLTHWRRHHKK